MNKDGNRDDALWLSVPIIMTKNDVIMNSVITNRVKHRGASQHSGVRTSPSCQARTRSTDYFRADRQYGPRSVVKSGSVKIVNFDDAKGGVEKVTKSL